MKRLFPLLLIFALLGSSCTSRETREARHLLALADSAFSTDHYDDVMRLVDSLNRTYPTAIKEREQAMVIYYDASLKRCRRDSLFIVEQMTQQQALLDSLSPSFVRVAADAKYVDRMRYKGIELGNRSGLDIFIFEGRELVIESSWRGPQPIKGEYLLLKDSSTDTYVSSDTLVYDNASNYRYQAGGVYYERLSFSSDTSMKLASFVFNTPKDHPIVVWLYGESGRSTSFQLSQQSRNIIGYTYMYAKTQRDLEDSRLRMSVITKRLEQLSSKVSK